MNMYKKGFCFLTTIAMAMAIYYNYRWTESLFGNKGSPIGHFGKNAIKIFLIKNKLFIADAIFFQFWRKLFLCLYFLIEKKNELSSYFKRTFGSNLLISRQ